MVLLESEKKVRRRCWCGSKIQTATLPDGNTTTDFQNWRVSFGAAKPKRKRTKVVMGLTKEAIEADRTGGYLHERLLEVVAPQNLFGADYYFIESSRAYKEFATIPTKIQRRLILKVIPRDPDPDTPVFDHRPAKTVKTQLKTRAAMTRYLVDLYTRDEFSLKQLGECMTHKMPDLRGVVHDQVPAHEKEEHGYLIAANRAAKESEIPNFKGSFLGRFPLAAKDKNKRLTLEQRYMSDEIDLLAYGDLRDPERKEKRLHDMAVYPLPERMYTCVVCAKPESAVIKCMECNNRTCRDCMYAKFINCPDDRAFVLLHHIYCLKLGEPILHQSKHKRAPKKAEH
ncbi:hypothetical protein JL721_8614 [Aureococcus anophagefferens]|nr:hypothetical protein JL721_8614 [Aureococcus anophagefferens]